MNYKKIIFCKIWIYNTPMSGWKDPGVCGQKQYMKVIFFFILCLPSYDDLGETLQLRSGWRSRSLEYVSLQLAMCFRGILFLRVESRLLIMFYILCQKLDYGSASAIRSRHVICNTNCPACFVIIDPLSAKLQVCEISQRGLHKCCETFPTRRTTAAGLDRFKRWYCR